MGWPGRAQRPNLLDCGWEALRKKLKEHAMRTSQKITGIVATIGIDIGKNTFHLVGFDQRGAIILQQKVSRSQLKRRVANIPRYLIGMEAYRPLSHRGLRDRMKRRTNGLPSATKRLGAMMAH